MRKNSKYKQAGVDIQLGQTLVERIKPFVKSTGRPGVIGGLGGFGGMFSLAEAGFKDPLLVSGTDGVGTKLKVAQMAGIHNTVGVDLVAMCVNDILTLGAEPLFFLDYYATGKLDVKTAQAVIKGVAEGCRQAGCALLGGETAEMPGFYGHGEYDLAGFVVGAVERKKAIDGSEIVPGDLLLGIKSSGLHSNGYSLARKVFFDKMKLSPSERLKGLRLNIGRELLRPTRIYVKSVLNALKSHRINGLAHITGGGITGNLPRILPKGLKAKINTGAWNIPEIFKILAREGDIDWEEMYEAFNMGIGMILVVNPKSAKSILAILRKMGEKAAVIGKVVSTRGAGKVSYI